MVRMEVKVISREIIRPSSVTPSHLRTFKLSVLDQFTPFFYVSIIFYYPISDSHPKEIKQISTRLKHSLSETLSRFFPLAGRIRDHLSIDCNDEGALFLEAQVSCDLSEFLENPKLESLYQFLPCPTFCMVPLDTAVQLAVQLNIFASGGIAISVCFSHKTVDGATMSYFLKCWSAIASNSCDKELIYPDYSVASQLFPQREELRDNESLLKGSWVTREGTGVQRRFVFDAAAISALKVKVRSDIVPNPSRVAVVSSFIWKCAMAAASKLALGRSKQHQPSVMAFAVNMRPRIVSPLSEYCTGNMVWLAIGPTQKDKLMELPDLVNLLREAIRKVNEEFIQSVQGKEGFRQISKFQEEVEEMYFNEKVDTFMFSSWCKFGFNEVDFGWGKPIWVSYTGGVKNPTFANFVLLMESAGCGDGIEAWVILDEHEMAILERDPEFLTFASLNPSIFTNPSASFIGLCG